ncbi:NmrA family NAD(P)-binding protein [Variovorax fucosicus]|uniref:NmrA family NAD(P)-binding protein n=1 Tax=Variovorax fucosicus TaxID=3053517 RepID=UPI00257506D3|nr:NmrA family NAD(P)-binding protein [Variovorax sp. J22G47]MDM0059054.1 NmrA family NAD(P)-binding protein [Variovorax sp. J22G47]
MSVPHRILVTGATGRLGRLLVPRLQARGATVRAFTRQSELADSLRPQGVEPAIGDFDDADALRRALEDVSHLFLLSPITPELAAQQIAVIDAAARAGVRRIVKLSGSHWTLEPPGRSLSGDAHARIEGALRDSGIPHRVLRPNAWLQVTLGRVAAELAAGDVLHVPPGDPRVAFIDVRDIADVAVEALFEDSDASPAPWVLTGGRPVGYGEIARIASQATGRRIVAEPLSAQALKERRAAAPSPYIAQVHAQFAELIAAGEAASVTATVSRVLGRPPRSVEAFLGETLAPH